MVALLFYGSVKGVEPHVHLFYFLCYGRTSLSNLEEMILVVITVQPRNEAWLSRRATTMRFSGTGWSASGWCSGLIKRWRSLKLRRFVENCA